VKAHHRQDFGGQGLACRSFSEGRRKETENNCLSLDTFELC